MCAGCTSSAGWTRRRRRRAVSRSRACSASSPTSDPQRYVTGHQLFAPAADATDRPPVPGLPPHVRDGPAVRAGVGLLGGLLYSSVGEGDPDRPRRIWDARFVLWLLVITVFIGEAGDHRRLVDGRDRAPAVGRLRGPADRGRPSRRCSAPSTWSCRSGCSSSCTRCCSCSSCTCSTQRSSTDPEPLEEVETVEMSSLPDTFRDVFRRRDRADVKELP